MSMRFNEYDFRQKVDTALQRVRTVLDNTRTPVLPEDCAHEYTDKYLLAEFLTNTCLAAEFNCLELLGLDASKLTQLKVWAADRSVTLRLAVSQTCKFNREQSRDIDSATKSETNSTFFGKSTHKVVTTVTEYFWDFEATWELSAFRGNAPQSADDRLVLRGRTGKYEIVTGSKQSPVAGATSSTPFDCNITWLLQKLGTDLQVNFAVDRSNAACRTPRRNPDVEAAAEELSRLSDWLRQASYMVEQLLCEQEQRLPAPRTEPDAPPPERLDLGLLSDAAAAVFVPVLPFFEKPAGAAIADAEPAADGRAAATPVLPAADVNRFLAEQKRSLAECLATVAAAFPAPTVAKVASQDEASLIVTLLHASEVAEQWRQGMDYIEHMLRTQLVAAIGKEVGPKDFRDYMLFHNKQLYGPAYQPAPFCQAIRRPDHYPDGTLSIEDRDNQPIYTTSRKLEEPLPMRFKINAATEVELGGERHVHCYLGHSFQGQAGEVLSLCARARQFSSFMLLVGKLGSADTFEPAHAIILQNKDELKIPLMLEQLPTAAEFRDAIESLSPEQQRFCQAFRKMQLEGSVFAVAVIQLKPQLERLLNLPDDSLTKEIALTQDLLELFIKYQIPSDLLTYDEGEGAAPERKLAAVNEHVAAIHSMLAKAKAEELRQAEEAKEMARLEAERKLAEKRAREEEMMQRSRMLSDSMEECEPMMMAASAAPRSRGMQMQRSAAPMMAAMAAPMAAAPMASNAVSYGRKGGGGKGGGGKGGGDSFDGPPAPKSAPNSAPPQQEQQKAADAVASPAPAPLDVAEAEAEALDLTQLPTQLDKAFDALPGDASVRPTTIKAGERWSKQFQKSLLAKGLESTSLSGGSLASEKDKAFDLLDALSRSGALPIDCASLHVVVAATHCFDKSLIATVVEDNENPIEAVERTSLVAAAAIHARPAQELVAGPQAARVMALLNRGV